MKKLIWVVAMVLALGAAYALAYQAAQPRGTDHGQIRATILEALDDLQNGQPGQAMRAISPAYKDSTGANRDRLYFLARQATQNRAYWDAVIEDMDVNVQGEEAAVLARVTVHRTEGGGATRHSVNLRMRREATHAYLVVPTTRWRVVSADNLPMEESAFGF